MEATTFKEAFAVLQGHAETLREQDEPNIDELLSIVTESVAAYKVCKQRIEAVDKALQEALRDVGSESGAPRGAPDASDGEPPVDRRPPPRASAPRAKPKSGTGFDDTSDDIPF